MWFHYQGTWYPRGHTMKRDMSSQPSCVNCKVTAHGLIQSLHFVAEGIWPTCRVRESRERNPGLRGSRPTHHTSNLRLWPPSPCFLLGLESGVLPPDQ